MKRQRIIAGSLLLAGAAGGVLLGGAGVLCDTGARVAAASFGALAVGLLCMAYGRARLASAFMIAGVALPFLLWAQAPSVGVGLQVRNATRGPVDVYLLGPDGGAYKAARIEGNGEGHLGVWSGESMDLFDADRYSVVVVISGTETSFVRRLHEYAGRGTIELVVSKQEDAYRVRVSGR